MLSVLVCPGLQLMELGMSSMEIRDQLWVVGPL